jgi:hypothetical protein
MQPQGEFPCVTDRRPALRGTAPGFVVRAAAVALIGVGLSAAGAAAHPESGGPINTGASNGGIATASSGGNVNIGEIVTGENTGNSIVTGDIGGVADISGGEINYPTDVNVTLNVGPPIASADGGDYGRAVAPSPEGPEFIANLDINNENKTNNRSDATAIGEGGEGGEGGAGGDVIINP